MKIRSLELEILLEAEGESRELLERKVEEFLNQFFAVSTKYRPFEKVRPSEMDSDEEDLYDENPNIKKLIVSIEAPDEYLE